MDNDPVIMDGEQESLRFPSKRDAWIVALLVLVIIIAFAGAIYVFTMSLSIVPLLVQEVVWIGVALFCLSILRSTYYTLTMDSIVVRTGPFRWTIDFDDILEVIPSRKVWSSAALSMDRLFINHQGFGGGTYISPENKGLFLEKLAERAPQLRLEGSKVIRVNTS